MTARNRPSAPLPNASPSPPEDLGYLLRQAAGAHRLRMDRALADLPVTPPQLLLLTLIEAYPDSSSADLARLSALTTATVSVIVGNLERLGAIERRPRDGHGRIQQLRLSAAGLDLLAACRVRARDVEAELAAGLTAQDEAAIRAWLKREAS